MLSEALHMIGEVAPVLIVDVESGKVEFVTPAIEKLFGYEVHSNALLGTDFILLLPEQIRESHKTQWTGLYENQDIQVTGRLMSVGLHHDGSEFPISMVFTSTKSRIELKWKVGILITDLREYLDPRTTEMKYAGK